MHSLLILVLATGLVAADVGLGYNYRPPTFAAYGVPSYQASATTGQYNIGYNNANGLNYKVTGLDQSSGYHGSGYHGTGYQGTGYQGTGYQGTGYQGAGYQGTGYQGTVYQGTGYQGSGQQGSGYQGSNVGFQNTANTVYKGNGGYQGYRPTSGFQNNYQGVYNIGNGQRENAHYQGQQFVTSSQYNEVNKGQSYQNYYQLSSQPAQIFKHFYVHAAPEDEEPPKPRTPIVLPPPQKHYKIIFIKAPTQAASAPQVIPVPQQTEEKTIVYVLVSKPEDAKNVVLPKLDQKPPAKPEVFFIKYNSKDGSQAAIDNIVKDYNNGQSVSFTNFNTGAPPPPSLLFGTYGIPGAQGGNIASLVSPVPQIVSNSGFGASNTVSQTGTGFGSKPLALAGVSDATSASSFVGTGTTATSNVDKGYSSASSGTGFNGVSSSAGFNGQSSGTKFNGVSSSAGFNGQSSGNKFNDVSSSTGFNGQSSGTKFSDVSSSAGFNGQSSGTKYNDVSSSAGFTGQSSGTKFNDDSSSAGFNDQSSGAGYNTATSSTGYNSASSSTGVPGASSITFNSVSGDAGYNSGSSSNDYSGITSTGTLSSLLDSEYKGSTISTSQGVPHESYGVPKFRA